MRIQFGWDLYGYLAQPDGTFLATRFLHVMFVPIFPSGGGFRVSADLQKVAPHTIYLPSVFAAYFKAWAFLIGAAMIAIGTNWGGWWHTPVLSVITAAGTLLFTAAIASWLFFGTNKVIRPLKRALVIGILGLSAAAIGTLINMKDVAEQRLRSGSEPSADHMIPLAEATAFLPENERISTQEKPGKGIGYLHEVELPVSGGYATVQFYGRTFMGRSMINKSGGSGRDLSWWVPSESLRFVMRGDAARTYGASEWKTTNGQVAVPMVKGFDAKVDDNTVLLTRDPTHDGGDLVIVLGVSNRQTPAQWASVHDRFEAKLEKYRSEKITTGSCGGVDGVVHVGTWGPPKDLRYRWACSFAHDGKAGAVVAEVPVTAKDRLPELTRLAAAVR